MSNKICNVTAKTISDVTGLDKTMASAFLRLLVAQGFASESGNRKQVTNKDGEYIVMRGRPSVLFDLDTDAVSASLGTDKASKIADKAATEHAEYTKILAHAEASAKVKRDAAAKAAKVDRLTAALAAVKAEGNQGDVF